MVGTLLAARQAAAQNIRAAQGTPAQQNQPAQPAQPQPAQQPVAQQPAPQRQARQPSSVTAYRGSRHRFLKTLAAMAAGATVLFLWQHRHDYAVVRTDRGTPEPRSAMQAYHDTNAGYREVIYDGGITLESTARFFDSFGDMVRSATGAYSDVAAASSRVKTVVASAKADRAEEEARGAAARFRTAWDKLTLADRQQSLDERAVRAADNHNDRVISQKRNVQNMNLEATKARRAEAEAKRAEVNARYTRLVKSTRGE